MPGIEPGASRMLSARSTTELHPHTGNHVKQSNLQGLLFGIDMSQ